MSTKTKNKAGLVERSDDAIFVEQSSFQDNWEVLKTKVHSNEATVIFNFETKEQALEAAKKIAEAIGVISHGLTDPRK